MRRPTALCMLAALCCALGLAGCAAPAPTVTRADIAESVAQQIESRLGVFPEVLCGEPASVAHESPLSCTIADPDTDASYDAEVAFTLDGDGALSVDFAVHVSH